MRHFLQKCRISPVFSQPELQRDEIDVFLQGLLFGDFGRRKIPALLQHWWGGTKQGRCFKPRLGKNAAELPTEPSKMMADWLAL
ncbi:hypothetical protein [Paenibacillus dendritiformis]|uniref:hypothetical protein n=1 Tax=Paenibacillus dendritiformis TaxID=130049 RepID=UPI00387E2086